MKKFTQKQMKISVLRFSTRPLFSAKFQFNGLGVLENIQPLFPVNLILGLH